VRVELAVLQGGQAGEMRSVTALMTLGPSCYLSPASQLQEHILRQQGDLLLCTTYVLSLTCRHTAPARGT
jgi:hypothetical protein